MIIIKGENKTSEVKFCKYNRETKKWDVEFCNGKIYPYAYQSVEWLRDPAVLNPKMYRICQGRQELRDIQIIYAFKGQCEEYWHICFDDGRERDYAKSNLTITESCLNDQKAADVFEYIKQIASLNELKNEETGERILAKRFEKIKLIGEEIALAKYLNPKLAESQEQGKDFIPIFPFGCNSSQYKAVKNAMENQISVIQGPPGTGKTQTILNIIANILMQGKTVQVVSNNNSATENVYEKLASSKYNLGFIVAELGSAKNKKNFISKQEAEYPDFSLWNIREDENISLEAIKEKSIRLGEVYKKREELAQIRQELSQLLTELQYFQKYLEETDVDPEVIKLRKKLSAKSWMSLWQECQMISEEKEKIGLLFKIKSFLKYGINAVTFYRQDLSKIITTFQFMYYGSQKKELQDRIKEIESYLDTAKNDLQDELCVESMKILKARLAEQYHGKTERMIFGEEDLWKRPEAVLKEYPVILSTTFSSRNSLNADVIYDYLIMDEASQVDIATGALALSCARNVIIVGDTKQLPNVVTEDMREQSQAVFDSFQIDKGYQFTNSFLQSILDVMPNVAQTLLREHYRCHPKIINFCNQKFYRGELIIMTEDKGEEDVLGVVRTVPGNHVRDHYSQRQIDVIKNEIILKYVTDRSETGIIAPYKNQVEALEQEFSDIDVATVHKFQGKEKDAIIISTVDDEITDFADDPYLINVAVSRAKKKLLLVVTGNEQSRERNIIDLVEYIQYQNFEVAESKIYSVFDYLYKQYTEERKLYLQKHKKISEYDSENLMYGLIEDILAEERFACLNTVCHFPMNMLIRNPELLNEQECQYVMNPATHLDFLIYNRITKKVALAIEVDGYDYHKKDTKQNSRDIMKNHILELYDIPLLRFRTNGSGEKEMIERKLEAILK